MKRRPYTSMRLVILTLIAIASLGLWSCHGGTASASLYVQHPDDPAKEVEYFVEKPAGAGPWPAIVLLHGHQGWFSSGGQVIAERGVLQRLAGRGYLAVAVSQPGYGNSSGPADWAGPFTQHAIAGVIAKLRADGEATNVVVEGMSLGAVAAGLVAAHDPSLSGVVMVSGVYDLPVYANDPDPGSEKRGVLRVLKHQTGSTADALNARSIMRYAADIKAPALILNGAQDDRTEAVQARSLAETIVRAGGKARAIIYPDFGHRIPDEVRNKDIDPFIDGVLRGDGGP